jgi:hypothetical protein
MVLFIIISIFYTLGVFPNECTKVTEISSPHLYWKWNDYDIISFVYYTLFLLSIVILSINGLEHGYHLAIISILSYIISFLIYNKNKSIGAMWCFISAFVPYIIPYVYQIKI